MNLQQPWRIFGPLVRRRVQAGPDPAALAIAGVGCSSVGIQVLLLRELLSMFHGNELTIGIILGNWLTLTAVGAFLGRRFGRRSAQPDVLAGLLVILSLLPPSSVLLLRILRNVVFTAGSMIGLAEATVTSLLVLAPYCVVAGCMFPLLSLALATREEEMVVSHAYAAEAIGSTTGGILVNILLVAVVTTFQALCLLSVVNLLGAMVLLASGRSRAVIPIGLLALVGLASPFLFDFDASSRSMVYGGQSVVLTRDTPYGELTLTREEGESSMFENGTLVASSVDPVAIEEHVHYGMLQRSGVQSVLLIGGSQSGMIAEVLKYAPAKVVIVEPNPWILLLGTQFRDTLFDRRIRIVSDDARVFVRGVADRFDAIVLNVPDPSTAQLNRFYTQEFFSDLKAICTNGAVISTALLPGAEYQGPLARAQLSTFANTLKGVFGNVLIVPGERIFFLASDGPLSLRICKLAEERGIETKYVNRYYIDDDAVAERSLELSRDIDTAAAVNMDFRPISYYQHIAYWASFFDAPLWIGLCLPVLVLALIVRRIDTISAVIGVAGFSATSLEVVLLLAFQALCGSLYQAVGMFVASFMVGLAVGAQTIRRRLRLCTMKVFIVLQVVLSALAVLTGVVLALLDGKAPPAWAVEGLLSVLMLLVGSVVGAEFSVAAGIRKGSVSSIASDLYSIDLLGSALGAYAVSVFAVPRFGVAAVSYGLAGLAFGAALLSLVWRPPLPSRSV